MRNSGAARDAAKFIGPARISQSFRSVSKRYAHNFEEHSLTNSRQRLNASLRFLYIELRTKTVRPEFFRASADSIVSSANPKNEIRIPLRFNDTDLSDNYTNH